MKRLRPYYNQSLEALSEAHKALYNYKPKDILAMSHGPFSGVNKVLGIVDFLEETCQLLYIENIKLKEKYMTDTAVNTITLPLSDEDAQKLAQKGQTPIINGEPAQYSEPATQEYKTEPQQ